MEQIKITGTLHHVGAIQNFSDKFFKREIVIKTDEKYPQHISIQLSNDKCELADHLHYGDTITCFINLRGREYNDKQTGAPRWFNTIEAWKIELGQKTNSYAQNTKEILATKSPAPSTPTKPAHDPLDQLLEDDLPF